MKSLDKNRITITGRVLRKIIREKVTFITVCADTYFNREGIRKYTTPTIAFPQGYRDDANSVSEGDNVSIIASVTTWRNLSGNGPLYNQIITGVRIRPIRSTLEKTYGIQGPSFIKPENSVLIGGSIYSIEERGEGLLCIRIGTTAIINERRRRSVILCKYFTNNVEGVLSDIHPKDYVCASGSLRTHRITDDTTGKTKTITDIVIRELQKL